MQRSELIRERLFECLHNGEIEVNDMVKIFELLADMLNVQTISEYARSENISYQAAIKRKLNKVKVNNIELVMFCD